MPIAAAIPRRTEDEQLAKRRRVLNAKVALFLVSVILLMWAGFRGRQHARVQTRLNEIVLVRDQLQQTLDAERRTAQKWVDGVRTTHTAAVTTLIGALQQRLEQFDFDHSPRHLSEAESLELRMSKATVASAEQRFADALTILTAEDERRARTDSDLRRPIRVLQIRGDSFRGLHDWREALNRYQAMQTLKPGRVATKARVAECQDALGRTNQIR